MEQDRHDAKPVMPVDCSLQEATCFVTGKNSPVPECVRSLTKGFPFARLNDLPAPAALQARVLVAFAPTAQEYGKVVHEIRRRPGLFLKPLLVLCRQSNQRWASCVDAEMILAPPAPVFRDIVSELHETGRRVDDFRPLDNHTRACRLHELLILRYLASRRSKKICPLANVHSHHAYDYPLARSLAAGTDTTGRELLQSLHEAGLLEGRVKDRVRVCPTCGDFRLNVRDVCPHCGSLVFTETETLRHLRCSYVGRKAEFQRDDVLECPKCDRLLHRPGVDYAEPKTNFWCGDCDRHFDEPDMQCHCLNCGDTLSLRDPDVRDFHEYEITTEGELAAEAGSYPETDVAGLLRDEPGLYHPRAFEQYYRLEVARSERYDVPGTVASLSIKNLADQIRNRTGPRAHRLTAEAKEILADTFRKTDLLTDISRNRVLAIFTHTPPGEARNGLERMEKNLRERVGDAIEVDADLYQLNADAPALEELRLQG
ncbi:MAG: hypothetical protein V5A84_04845 [Planctomycetota bacterium]